VGQVVALHTHCPLTHFCPVVHAALLPHLQPPEAQLSARFGSQVVHAPPAGPHAVIVGVVHTLVVLQQPLGHEVASQTHCPPTHLCPSAHAAPLPHWQPPATQVSAFIASQALHGPPLAPQLATEGVAQVVPLQQPLGQLVAQLEQAPFTQVSPAGQAMHAPPLVPQAVAVPTLHTFPWQHPVGQLVGLHTHAPPTQA
jgi:type IV secretory pathway VirB10-like protein